MFRLGAVALVSLLGACASSPRIDAGAEISAWVRSHYGDTVRGEPQIFLGDFTGDGASDALAWVMYNDGGVHNFGEGVLFRNVSGHLIYWRIDDTASGETPRDVSISRGRIRLTTTVLQDGDARCCPTGEQRWTIETR